ncbi:MAG: M23 family metallopeptidase [Desulfobacteraceae bacterium]|jgi:murein DD-endopeptidase MepM/ murein hydrolase activator NlpD|nr:M23 family metallopeptidase [Desulfobacteraceae bacterium]
MKLTLKKNIGRAATASIFLGALLCSAWAADSNLAGQTSGILLSTTQVTNGNPLLVQIDTRKLNPPITAMGLKFQDREFPVYRHPVNPADYRFGLIGIPYRQTPGPAELALKWSNAAGEHVQTIPFEIINGKYRTDVLKVDQARVNPSKKNIKRTQKEARRLGQTYAHGSIARLWNGAFQLPMASEITSPFGNRRLFNGQLKSYHNGVDFRAPLGTPVFAANAGVVKVAENLFYSGNVVIIDHGNKIFTIYAHLSKIGVTAGQKIEKGQQLGLTGASGRVSGPHLHWGVKVNGTAVNPIQFISVMGSLIKEPG